MIKSKTLIMLAGVGSLSAAAVIPVVVLSNNFSDTFKKANDGSDATRVPDASLDESLKDSNQGFEAISVLGIKSELDSVDNLSEQSMKERLYAANKKLVGKEIYIKGITLKKVKFTVENYSGTAEVSYKITDLNSLIKEKELGKIKDVRSTSIIEKIKEINPLLSGVSFEDELSFDIVSLDKILVTLNVGEGNTRSAKDYSQSLTLDYKCTSIEGLFSENDLGEVVDLREANISNKVKAANNHLAFASEKEYEFKFVDAAAQSPNGVKVNLYYNGQLQKFDDASFLNITYNVSSIETIITNLNLGEINSISSEDILNKVISLNPIFGNYNALKNTTVKSIGLNSAVISNTNLKSQVTVNYVIKNLSGLLLSTDISDVENYNSSSSTERDNALIKLIKTANPILNDLSSSSMNISSVKLNSSFGLTDEYISGNSFVLSISGYNGTLSYTFKIKRINIEKFLKVTDLGSIYWINSSEIIQKIKDRNGADFNQDEMVFSTPNYTGLQVTAKTGSYNYYGVVNIKYTTTFKKTTGFNLNAATNGTISSDTFTADQGVYGNGLWGSHVTTSSSSSVEMKYAIPDGYTKASAAYSKFKFNAVVKATSLQAGKTVSASTLNSNQTSREISVNLSSISTSYSGQTSFGQQSYSLTFRTRNWTGAYCTGGDKSWGYSTNINYQIARETTGGVDYIKIKFLLSSSMETYSTCDNVLADYQVYLNSVDIS
ncbi:hypothetical protein SCHIN_v1c02520 [Spiroplasma chinense]|uniref:Chitinase n=1 Tax=Spiroplasma chinense TaxID=216932 RepID=A0A5B9Y447_9MOLU|nr:hypothetical protein [Spiroplasma chinense]QEH61449.1 hypothetical protein SCHIN_v1c02520 [Spiroplasma chinense]